MPVATIIRAYADDQNAYIAARVPEGGRLGNVEYYAQTPLLEDDGSIKPIPRLRADLTLALKEIRDKQVRTTSPLAAIAGTVTI